MTRFNAKQFVITGGSGGIGFATAERLLKEGARVLVTGTSASKLNAAQAKHPALLTLLNDAGQARSHEALAEAVREHFGQIDGLFLNAGYGLFTPHDSVTAEQFDAQFNVNVRGPILEAAALSGLMREGGSIVINTSVVQDLGMSGGVLYGASKGALRTVTRTLAAELAGRSIRVNAVSPGPIGSDFFERTGIPKDQVAQMAEGIRSRVPLGRFGEVEEIASVVAFLFSEDASFMTGSEVVVDGGMTQV